MKQAVFLDRDGVLNQLIYNPITGEYESPHVVEDLHIFSYVEVCLKELQAQGYLLFLISNQPSYAKGKTSMENIQVIHETLVQSIAQGNIDFEEYYYCYHHPQGVVPEYTGICQCRKPGNYFLKQAQEQYQLDMEQSWFIGDQDSDIFCGQSCGMNTILITNPYSHKKRGNSKPSSYAGDLQEAVRLILKK